MQGASSSSNSSTSNGSRFGRTMTVWMCLDEHICSVGEEVVWGKVPGFPWWPGQKILRSGLELLRKAKEDPLLCPPYAIRKQPTTKIDALSSLASSSSSSLPGSLSSSPTTSSSVRINSLSPPRDYVIVYFFLDENYALMRVYPDGSGGSSSNILPLGKRSKEIKSGMGKVSRVKSVALDIIVS